MAVDWAKKGGMKSSNQIELQRWIQSSKQQQAARRGSFEL